MRNVRILIVLTILLSTTSCVTLWKTEEAPAQPVITDPCAGRFRIILDPGWEQRLTRHEREQITLLNKGVKKDCR